MRVAVVTPTCNERLEWLRQCHDSVRAQTHPCTHFVISDGSGPNPLGASFEGQYLELPQRHHNWGDTPRSVGALSAYAQGYDAVCWLDDDNWLYPDHTAALVQLQTESKARVCTALRDIYHRDDGRLLGREPDKLDDQFRDANCLMVMRSAAQLATLWTLMPEPWHAAGDIYFWAHVLHSGARVAHGKRVTVGYRANSLHSYRQFGVTPPPGTRDTDSVWQNLKAQGLIRTENGRMVIV